MVLSKLKWQLLSMLPQLGWDPAYFQLGVGFVGIPGSRRGISPEERKRKRDDTEESVVWYTVEDPIPKRRDEIFMVRYSPVTGPLLHL